jgi:hypothetical protein
MSIPRRREPTIMERVRWRCCWGRHEKTSAVYIRKSKKIGSDHTKLNVQRNGNDIAAKAIAKTAVVGDWLNRYANNPIPARKRAQKSKEITVGAV